MRGLVLTTADAEYVQASRLLGSSARSALFRVVLPNVIGPVIVLATLDLGNAILLLSGLSFLGLGAQPPSPEWGQMVSTGNRVLPELVAEHLPGSRDLHRRARVQLPRRQPARRLRPAHRRQGRAGVSALLEVEDLSVRLATRGGGVTVVNGISYAVEPGSVFGIAGESGSGKTMSALALLGLLPRRRVRARSRVFGGRDLLHLSKRALRDVRGREIAMVFQDPLTALHPMMNIGRQLTEHVRRHLGLSKADALTRAASCSTDVRIPDPEGALVSFPHQFSGGMRQRIAIAAALACEPQLIVADEPTTALDVTVQAGILRLLDDLRREKGLSVILITHDLGVMSSIADRVSVMYAGRVVEEGPRDLVLREPRHPYTKALLRALPRPESSKASPLVSIPGAPPSPSAVPSGCAFHPRCEFAIRAASPRCRRCSGRATATFACPVDPFGAAA